MIPLQYHLVEGSKSKLSSPNKKQLKNKSKMKKKDQPVRIKTKFTPGQIEFISEQLKDVIFSAWVGEREYVENLNAYRDIIEIDEWESEINQRLKTVMYGIKGVMEGTKWLNITAPSSISSCYCLWVLLQKVPFPGHYWMRITSIESDSEIGLKINVEILRKIHAFDGESRQDRDRRLKGEMTPDDWKDWLFSAANLNFQKMWLNLTHVFTPSNISAGFRLLIILSVTLVVAFMRCLKEFRILFSRLIRELGIFVHHATPLAESIMRFLEKIVGGFYLLLAMIYRDLRQPKAPHHSSYPPPTYRSFLEERSTQQRALT